MPFTDVSVPKVRDGTLLNKPPDCPIVCGQNILHQAMAFKMLGKPSCFVLMSLSEG